MLDINKTIHVMCLHDVHNFGVKKVGGQLVSYYL